jgi:glutamate synthase (NADPH/NADH) small chain
VDYGQEEAIKLFGSDPRKYCITARKFTGDAEGNVKEVHTVGIEWTKDASGRFVPVEIPGSEKIFPARLVLLAMGFLGPEEYALEQLAIERDNRSNVKTVSGKYSTNVKGVFTAVTCIQAKVLL